MHKPTSPFTREQLLPKEETLELTKEKGTLFIGIPKETSFQEKRVCLTPDAVSALTSNGHRLLIESGAGENAFLRIMSIARQEQKFQRTEQKYFHAPLFLRLNPLL